VETDADHVPASAQLLIVSICAAGAPCPWVAAKLSDCALALMHDAGGGCVGVGDAGGGCVGVGDAGSVVDGGSTGAETVNVTSTFTVLDPSVKMS